MKIMKLCVNDRIVTSGHIHRSSYAELVNNGDIHVTYSHSIPMYTLQSIYILCRRFQVTKSTGIQISNMFDIVH